jgi:hypothetical protein
MQATTIFSLALLFLCSCGEVTQEAEKNTDNTSSKENTFIQLPDYTVVKSDVDAKDASYRIQVGDTLPNEQQSIAIFKKVSGIEEGPVSRNTAVYFTRAGYSIHDAQAYVMYTKSDNEPQYKLQSASNDRLKKTEALTFDSIPNKKMIVECLEAQGAKIIIYQKPSGEYFKVMIFESGGYDIEPMKAGPGNSASTIVLNITEDGEKFTYKEDLTGKTMEVYNGENIVINSYKILKKDNY